MNRKPGTRRFRDSCIVASCIGLLIAIPGLAQENTPETTQERPKIGLVLGGGGAKGGAHVGVLKVLEEMRIPIDYIGGTSMGSIVGGLYASGLTPEQIEHELQTIDWEDIFHDAPNREQRSFRRKRDDDNYAWDAAVGFNNGEFEIPLAVIRGQKLDLALTRLTLPAIDVPDFDGLPIPFRAVATDIETGNAVVLDSGSLAMAIRASMAVPAVFDPVEIDGRLLIDGGIASNVPVSAVRAMGADIIIAVDVGTGYIKREDIENALDITAQLSNFLTGINTARQLELLGPDDVFVHPQLGDITAGSFDRVGETIVLGIEGAHAAAADLQRLSVNEEAYATHVASRRQISSALPVIDNVLVDNQSRLGDEVIADRISAEPGAALDVDQLETDIGQVYGLDVFENVRYDLVRQNDQNNLVVTAVEKHWGPGYLQFGLASSNNFEGDSTLRLGIAYTRTALNELNGELRVATQLGDAGGLFAEMHQPLDSLSRFFVSGRAGLYSRNLNTFDSDGNQLARYQLQSWGGELNVGREFGTWGEGRIGYRRLSGDAEVRIGEPVPDLNIDRGDLFARLSADRMDSLYFPRKGMFARAEYVRSREDYGSSADYNQWLLAYTQAFSFGANTIIGGLATARTEDDNAPIEGMFQVGGLFRLSGLQEDQLSGQHVGIASFIYMRELARSSLLKTYLGASIETGNAWQDSSDIGLSDSILAGSLFVGLDTPIGPIYLAYGMADTDDSSLYLYIGPRLVF